MVETHLQSIQLERPSAQRLAALKIESWPLWEREVSQFTWHYDDAETCYLLAGRVEVSSADGLVEFGEGDLVVFPKGLSCTWTVKSPVRKRYQTGTL